MKTEDIEPFRRLPGAGDQHPDKWNPKSASDVRSFPNVSPKKEDNETERQECGDRRRHVRQGSELRDQMSAMLGELDYFRREVVRFWKFSEEIPDTLNHASNHIFCHLRIDR